MGRGYIWDDWEISSHTIDFRYRYALSERHYIEPHLRYYTQEEAEFFQHSLVFGASLPEYASADPRLGSFDAITYGIKYGFRLNSNSEVSIRVESYEQNGNTVGSPIGIQNNYDLFPDLEAIIVQISYSHNF